MDDPKKAAKKLLQFYQGEKLKELLEYLNKGLDETIDTKQKKITQDDLDSDDDTKLSSNSTKIKTISNNKHLDLDSKSSANTPKETKPLVHRNKSISEKQFTNNKLLTTSELARRLKVKLKTLTNYLQKNPGNFKNWTKKKDPDGIAWQKTDRKKGRSNMFEPIEKVEQEETT